MYLLTYLLTVYYVTIVGNFFFFQTVKNFANRLRLTKLKTKTNHFSLFGLYSAKQPNNFIFSNNHYKRGTKLITFAIKNFETFFCRIFQNRNN